MFVLPCFLLLVLLLLCFNVQCSKVLARVFVRSLLLLPLTLNAKRQKLWEGDDDSLPAYLSTVSSDYRGILAPFLCFLVSQIVKGFSLRKSQHRLERGVAPAGRASREMGICRGRGSKNELAPVMYRV